MGDISAGVKWNFLKGLFSAATAFDLEFPSGGREFREPRIEPTLSVISGWKMGSFEPSCTLSGTYVSAEDGDKAYLSYLISLGLDYALNDAHSFSLFATGYTPAESTDRSSRISGGILYTLMLNEWNSYSLTLTKGLSERGMDWSIGLSCDFRFTLRSLFADVETPMKPDR